MRNVFLVMVCVIDEKTHIFEVKSFKKSFLNYICVQAVLSCFLFFSLFVTLLKTQIKIKK